MAAVITPEAAIAAGISPTSLRQVASWNADVAESAKVEQLAEHASRRAA